MYSRKKTLVDALLNSEEAATKYIGIIHILRQQKDWVGGFKTCQFLVSFSTIFMLT